LSDEYSRVNSFSPEDVRRLYVGAGIAKCLIWEGLGNRFKKRAQFTEAICEPQGFYDSTMGSDIFDDIHADETARRVAVDGYDITATVNITRLAAGMFLEVQPDTKEMTEKIKDAFQDELAVAFSGKQSLLETGNDLGITDDEAKMKFAENVAEILGLSFPMQIREVKKLLKILSWIFEQTVQNSSRSSSAIQVLVANFHGS